MEDIRLHEMPFSLEGVSYTLRCNMNVLADIQNSAEDQNIITVLKRGALEAALVSLAAMINDDADSRGLAKRYSAKELGRKLHYDEVPVVGILDLVYSEILRDSAESENAPVVTNDTAESETPEGN